MHAAGLSFAFAGDTHDAGHGEVPMWLLPAQPEAPHADSYDDAMDELVEDVLVDEATSPAPAEPEHAPMDERVEEPALDDPSAAILRLRGRL